MRRSGIPREIDLIGVPQSLILRFGSEPAPLFIDEGTWVERSEGVLVRAVNVPGSGKGSSATPAFLTHLGTQTPGFC